MYSMPVSNLVAAMEQLLVSALKGIGRRTLYGSKSSKIHYEFMLLAVFKL